MKIKDFDEAKRLISEIEKIDLAFRIVSGGENCYMAYQSGERIKFLEDLNVNQVVLGELNKRRKKIESKLNSIGVEL